MATEFPAFLKLEYRRDASAGQTLLAEVESTFDRAEKRFQEFSGEANRLLDQAMGRGRTKGGSLDLDVSGMRDFARVQQTAAIAARELADATRQAADSVGDFSPKARAAVAAIEAEAVARVQAARAAVSHAEAVEQVQAALGRSQASVLTGQYLELARAEAAAADGARHLAAISANTGLDRVARSARESAAAFDLMFQAQAANDEKASQSFLNTAFGLDRQAKSARDSAAAFEEMFAAQQKNAASASDLRARLDPMFAVQQRFDNELREADRLLEAGAISTREYAQAQQLARDTLRGSAEAIHAGNEALSRGTDAQRLMTGESRRFQVAMLQSGQQLQDFGVQIYSGQRASVAFAQQLPQLAFALSMLEGSANKTANRVGKFATFLSGPWGVAVGLGAVAVGALVGALLENEEAADKVEKAHQSLADKLDLTKNSFEAVLVASREYNAESARTAETALQAAAAAATEARENYSVAAAIRERLQASLELQQSRVFDGTNASGVEGGVGPATVQAVRVGGIEAALARNERSMAQLRTSVENTTFDYATELAKLQSDPVARITEQFKNLREELRGSTGDAKELARGIAALNRQEEAQVEAVRASERRIRKPRAKAPALPDVTAEELEQALGVRATSKRRTPFQNRKAGGAANSYHLLGQAIDIPLSVNGKPFTKEGIRAALEPLGVEIKELLGPGDRNHSDHFHVAFARKRLEPDKVAENAAKLTDSEKAYLEAAEAAAKFNGGLIDQQLALELTGAQFENLRIEAAAAAAEQAAMIAPTEEGATALREMAAAIRANGEELRALEGITAISDLNESLDRQLEVEKLLLGGRREEAAVVQEIWRFEQQVARDALPEEKAQIEAIVRAREAEFETVGRLAEQQAAYLDATRSTLGELESLFAGEGFDLERVFKRMQARVTVEAIFGDSLRDLDDKVRAKYDIAADQVKAQNLELEVSLSRLTTAVTNAAVGISGAVTRGGAANDNALPAGFYEDFDRALPGTRAGGVTGVPGVDADGTINVIANGENTREGIEKSDTALALTPQAYAEMLGKALVDPLLIGLPEGMAASLSPILGKAVGGYLTGGIPGGVLGALKGGVFEFGPDMFGKAATEGILKGLDKAAGGAQTGTQVNALFDSLGIKSSKSGAQLGGAAGSFFGPGGALIGSVAGGLLGGLFKKKEYGTALLTDLESVSTLGRGSGRADQAGTLGGSVQSGIRQIVDQLDAELGDFRVSIGTYKDRFRVSTRGDSGKLGGYKGSAAQNEARYGLYDFETEEEAIRFALRDAVSDGAIRGLRDAEQRLLNQSGDIEAAIADVLDFRSVFGRLKAYRDPVGAALDDLDKEFDRLGDLFAKAGASTAELADLEELYGIERARAVQEAGERVTGALRSLFDDLSIGDNGLSLRDRRANAMMEYDALATRVRGGDVTAYDGFAESARALLEIERELFGSTSDYFARFDEVKGLTGSVLAEQERLAKEAANRDSPFDSNGRAVNDNQAVIEGLDRLGTNLLDGLLGGLAPRLDAINSNLGSLIGSQPSRGIEIARFGSVSYF